MCRERANSRDVAVQPMLLALSLPGKEAWLVTKYRVMTLFPPLVPLADPSTDEFTVI